MTETLRLSVENKMAIEEAICRPEKAADEEGAPSGGSENHELSVSAGEGEAPDKRERDERDERADSEQLERKRKTRRRKTKRKNPYNKVLPTSRGKKTIKTEPRGAPYAPNQPVAPYNTNQFLIEDHNDLKDFDAKLMEVTSKAETGGGCSSMGGLRGGRQRDPSFTSAESDQEFYSSPEDEEEFLTKEFSNTYRDLHVESLAAMSKTDLIQTVLQLEEKVDSLEKKLRRYTGLEESSSKEEGEARLQSEISKLTHVNEELSLENAKLREERERGDRSPSPGHSSVSEDSVSDSSSSSEDTSEMSPDDHNSASPRYDHMNGDMDCETDLSPSIQPANVT